MADNDFDLLKDLAKATSQAEQIDILKRIITTLGENAPETLLSNLEMLVTILFDVWDNPNNQLRVTPNTITAAVVGLSNVADARINPATEDTLADGLGGDGGTPPTDGTGIRGWLRSIYDKVVSLLAKDTAGRLAVTAHSSLGKDVSDGLVFAAGDEIVLASGQAGSIVVDNPAVSGVVWILIKLVIKHSVTDSLDVVYFKNPTITGGVTLTPFNLNQSSVNTSAVIMTAGQGILSGGTLLDVHGRSTRDEGDVVEGPIIIPPGVKIGFQLQAPGGLAGGTDLSATAIFKEVPV